MEITPETIGTIAIIILFLAAIAEILRRLKR